MKKLLLALMLLVSASFVSKPAMALDISHDDVIHLTAHAGASFLLQTGFYGFNKEVFKMGKVESEVLAFASTMAIGYLYKFSENAPASDVARAMSENALGAALAVVTHVTFHF